MAIVDPDESEVTTTWGATNKKPRQFKISDAIDTTMMFSSPNRKRRRFDDDNGVTISFNEKIDDSTCTNRIDLSGIDSEVDADTKKRMYKAFLAAGDTAASKRKTVVLVGSIFFVLGLGIINGGYHGFPTSIYVLIKCVGGLLVFGTAAGVIVRWCRIGTDMRNDVTHQFYAELGEAGAEDLYDKIWAKHQDMLVQIVKEEDARRSR